MFFLSWRIDSLSASTARALFFVYAALLGASLSIIFAVYTDASITRVFFISAAAFGGLSLWGYTTQRDLTGMGSFLMMGLIGIIIASLVNIFLKSSGLDWIISVIGVIVFAGLTAWDTQKIKEMYDVNDDGTVAGRKAVMGALVALSRLHQPVPDAAAPVRRPALIRQADRAKRPGDRRGVFVLALLAHERHRTSAPPTPADIPAITRIYAHAVRHGTASFELEPPDEAEMARRQRALFDGGYPYLVAEIDGARRRLRLCGALPDAAGLSLQRRELDLRRAGSASPRHRPRAARSR